MRDVSLKAIENRYGPGWRWLAVITVMLGTMASVLSATIVNVALPDIMADFNIRQGVAHWFATGFIAAMTASMLTTGWLLDRFGLRRTLAAAMLTFSALSLAGGFADGPIPLVAIRIGQGAMAGLMQPMAMYLVFRIFPREERGRAMGIYGMGVILAPALGPVLGGFLVDQLDWRYVLFAPAPVTLAGALMVRYFIPATTTRPQPYPFDGPGLVWLILTLAASLDALNRLQHGLDRPLIASAGALVAVFGLWNFIRRERRTAHPLMKIELLRDASFRSACLGALALGLALFGSTYLIPLFVQSPPLSYSATEAGLLMLPAGIALGIVFPIAGRLADRLPPRRLILIGIMVFGLSTTLFAVSDITTGFLWLAVWAILGRIGLGFMLPALSTGALNPLPNELLGHGSGMVNFMRMLGGAYGVNAVALAIEFGPHDQTLPTVQAFHGAWWLVTIMVLVATLPVSRIRS